MAEPAPKEVEHRMRRSDKAGTDSESLLREAPVCRLGFSGGGPPGRSGAGPAEGYPYVVPLHFVWDGEYLYVHCAGEGEKLRRLARDDRVCVEIDELTGIVPAPRPCRFSTRFRSLIAFGRAARIDDVREKRRALAALTTKYAGAEFAGWRFEARELESVTIVRINLENMSVKQSGRGASTDETGV
jgi:nitroimidazol reductase NimA-like FMN-containing flavoprotein (pyridoxamine 5'-phosphate oxidase superfamily)